MAVFTMEQESRIRQIIGEELGICGNSVGGDCDLPVASSAEPAHKIGVEEAIADLLRSMGMPTHIRGYRYVSYAIHLVIDDVRYLDAVTKRLYPGIAKVYNTTPSSVERSIRHAVETAWDRGSIKVAEKYFGCTISPRKDKPTNSEFISTLAFLYKKSQ